MTWGATVAMLTAAGLASCCTVVDPRARSVAVWAPSVIMLLAMVDVGVMRTTPAVVWAAALTLAGMFAGWRLRMEAPSTSIRHRNMQLHRTVACLFAAGLVLLHENGVPAAAGSHTHSGPVLQLVVTLGAISVLVFGIVLALRASPAVASNSSAQAVVLLARRSEPLLMSASLAAMVAPGFF